MSGGSHSVREKDLGGSFEPKYHKGSPDFIHNAARKGL